MTIYVDELKSYGQKPKAGGERHFGNGKRSCHMSIDNDNLDELHAFAARIGLRREWFQDDSTPHYDLTPNKRAEAIRAGAVPVSMVEFVQRCSRFLRERMRAPAAPNAGTTEGTERR